MRTPLVSFCGHPRPSPCQIPPRTSTTRRRSDSQASSYGSAPRVDTSGRCCADRTSAEGPSLARTSRLCDPPIQPPSPRPALGHDVRGARSSRPDAVRRSRPAAVGSGGALSAALVAGSRAGLAQRRQTTPRPSRVAWIPWSSRPPRRVVTVITMLGPFDRLQPYRPSGPKERERAGRRRPNGPYGSDGEMQHPARAGTFGRPASTQGQSGGEPTGPEFLKPLHIVRTVRSVKRQARGSGGADGPDDRTQAVADSLEPRRWPAGPVAQGSAANHASLENSGRRVPRTVRTVLTVRCDVPCAQGARRVHFEGAVEVSKRWQPSS